MTIYVDDMYKYPIGQFGRMKMSHMIADSEDELHRLAAILGIARRWYQDDHYDIAMSKRVEAIRLGAIPITYKQCGCMCGVRKITGKLPAPHEAQSMLLELYEERKGQKDGHGNHQG